MNTNLNTEQVTLIRQTLNILNNEPGIKALIDLAKSKGGKVGIIGGFVRDIFTEKASKDIDLIVLKVSMEDIITTLKPFGKTDLVGESFGVIKFTEKHGDVVDIAIPRKEVKVSEGHGGFEIQSNKDFTIEDDLIRRDFTMNAIVLWTDGTFFDPFNGIKSIKEGVIRMVNPKAFSEDPLRILRAVGFLSRFGFMFSNELHAQIVDNVNKLKEIAPERVFEEFKKFTKGNAEINRAIEIMNHTMISDVLLGFPINIASAKIKTFMDLIIISLSSIESNKSRGTLAKEIFTADKVLCKFLDKEEAIKTNICKCTEAEEDILQLKKDIISLWNISSELIKDNSFNSSQVLEILEEIESGLLITSSNKLEINGFELMKFGLKDKQIADMKNMLFELVIMNKLENNNKALHLEVAKTAK